MNITGNHVVIALLICLATFFCIKSCNQSASIDVIKQQRDLAQAAADTLRLKDGVYSKQSYIASDKDILIAELTKSNTELAKMVQAKNTVGVRTVTNTVYRDTGRTIIDTVRDTRTAYIRTPWYDADIVSAPDVTTLDITRMTDTVSYSLDKDNRLNAKHTNPHVQVTELESFYVKPVQKKKNWKYVVGGIVVGGLVYGMR